MLPLGFQVALNISLINSVEHFFPPEKFYIAIKDKILIFGLDKLFQCIFVLNI